MRGPSSVRVEFEDPSDTPSGELPVASPTSSPSNRRALVGAALLALVVLLAAIDTLRPTDGETAADDELVSSTTTVAPAPSAAVAPPIAPTTSGPAELLELGGESEFVNSDVVRGEAGFLALLASDSVENSPSLYRSENGADWERVEATLAPFLEKGDHTVIEYSNLISTPEGFALLRTRTCLLYTSPSPRDRG